jgi:hypothetical protein
MVTTPPLEGETLAAYATQRMIYMAGRSRRLVGTVAGIEDRGDRVEIRVRRSDDLRLWRASLDCVGTPLMSQVAAPDPRTDALVDRLYFHAAWQGVPLLVCHEVPSESAVVLS